MPVPRSPLDSTVQPLGITTLSHHDISNRRFVTTTTDPNGNITKQYYDYEGRQVQLTDANGGITTMHYDNLGQLLWSQDPEGFTTYYGYDKFGHLKYRDHPDAGHTEYKYDPAGNLTLETNPLGEIYYEYTYYRHTGKRYSYMSGNDVTYKYGTTGNDIGRPVFITDGSGSYECHYDELGNVTEEIRTIALPKNDNEVYRFHMEYDYDSWGRIHTMVYPDGEKVKYEYNDWGGDLISMYGNNLYIMDIRYNAFGQRDSIAYGNGTYANYTYDSLHRLSYLESHEGGGNMMQKIEYTFDHASNIKCINNSNVLPFGFFDGRYDNSYEYDGLHRLVGSEGNNMLGQYIMNMDYTPSGRIAHKKYSLPAGALSHSADMFYGYCDDYQPHAARRIYDQENDMLYDFRWDKAGNLGQISLAGKEALFKSGRFLFWTEDNRLHTAVDEKHYSYYVYDHSGERRVKLTGESEWLDANANLMLTGTLLYKPTLYPSPYLVLSMNEYTKHYYAGAERVAACLGGGGLDIVLGNNLTEPTAPAYSTPWGGLFDNGSTDPEEVIVNDTIVMLQEASTKLFEQSGWQVNQRELNGNELNCIAEIDAYHAELHRTIAGIPDRMETGITLDFDKFHDKVRDLKKIQHDEREYVYYYHGDHLGSASWITNHDGNPVQHLQYLPYGEPYVDQRTIGYSERFRFTGKERDEETGYGYFGARYMDHELMTSWLSVDPMADKYPSISPYNYCMWNPVKLIDPDGRDVWEVSEDGHVQRKSEEGGNKKQIVKYANGKTTTFRGTRYHNIMSDLSATSDNGVSSTVGGEDMQSAYAKVFKSMADNTNVEWIIHRYSDNNYALGTEHHISVSPESINLSKGRYRDKDVIALLHSHPMTGRINPTSLEEQVSSMGYCDKTLGYRLGDAKNKLNSLSHVSYYTYFPLTKQLWSVGRYRPAFIRNIKSFSDFFFGTINTK